MSADTAAVLAAIAAMRARATEARVVLAGRPARIVDDAIALADVAEAAARLAGRLRAIHDDPQYLGVWTLAQVHVGPYTGPTYVDEHDALDAALARMAEVAG